MWNYGLSGLVIGFIAGMGVNAYLLRGTPRAEYLNNGKMRTRYGTLNWVIALIGLVIGLAIGETRI